MSQNKPALITILAFCVIALAALWWQVNSKQHISNQVQQSTPTPMVTHATTHHMTIRDEQDFLVQMIPHHQEAVETSLLLQKQTDNIDLQAFTQAVISAQTAEIIQMKQWLRDWYQVEYQEDGSYMPMMGNLDSMEGVALEQAYIRDMIVHHQGAVDMAEQVLLLGKQAEVHTLAQNIIATQRAEIATLQNWLVDTTNHQLLGH